VFFSRTEGANNRAARMTVQGGEVTLISKAIFSPTAISPDGRQLVGPAWSEELRRPVVALLSVAGGDLRELPDIPALGAAFAPDRSALFFPDLTARPVRLMLRPLPDGVAKPIGGRIPDVTFAGAVSRDGRIAVSSGTLESDAVLISAGPARKQ
jgi:hypothetical protein